MRNANSPPTPKTMNLICQRIRPVEDRIVRSKLNTIRIETRRKKNCKARPAQSNGSAQRAAPSSSAAPVKSDFLETVTKTRGAIKKAANSHFHLDRDSREFTRAYLTLKPNHTPGTSAEIAISRF